MSSSLLTVEQVAAQLGTTVRHVRELRYRREIPAVKIGGALRFEQASIDALIDAHREPATGALAAGVQKWAPRPDPRPESPAEHATDELGGAA